MQSLISVHASYDDAAKTLEDLKHAGYGENQLEVFNRDEIINHHLYLNHNTKIETIEIASFLVLGAVAGIMLSTGAITIPGEHYQHTSNLFSGVLHLP